MHFLASQGGLSLESGQRCSGLVAFQLDGVVPLFVSLVKVTVSRGCQLNLPQCEEIKS